MILKTEKLVFLPERMLFHNNVKEYLLKDICRATSAAPTYFKPASIKSQFGNKMALIDGGVFANNPALCAYIEAMKTSFGNQTDKPDLSVNRQYNSNFNGDGQVLKKPTIMMI